jgi:hypothetical protein
MSIPLDIRRIDTRLHQCAQNLQDQKHLAKLSAGYVVAQELRYHGNTSTNLCSASPEQTKKAELLTNNKKQKYENQIDKNN